MVSLLVATTNPGKLREIENALGGVPIQIQSLRDFSPVPLVEEDGSTFWENALKKARAYAAWSGLPTLADDSGLVVPALGGDPGVHSARYAGPQATDEENLRKLIEEVSRLPATERQAYYVCVLAFVQAGSEPVLIEERCSGEIILDRRGMGGFGYDPVFYLPELGKTMAEIPIELKNQISHRGKALRKFSSSLLNFD